MELLAGFEPVSGALAAPCLEPTGPTVRMVGVGRIELPPRVPKTRMLALHHTQSELVRQVRLAPPNPLLKRQVP